MLTEEAHLDRQRDGQHKAWVGTATVGRGEADEEAVDSRVDDDRAHQLPPSGA